MKAKRWIVREHDAERAASLARVLGVSPILAALLITRGYADQREARVFLTPTYDQLHEPYSQSGLRFVRQVVLSSKTVEHVDGAFELGHRRSW